MTEIWSELEGYSNYAVSNQGRVINKKLNKIVSSRGNGSSEVMSIQSDEGFSHRFSVSRLVEMGDFSSPLSHIPTRKIRVLETNQVFNNAEEASKGLLVELSSIYRALRGVYSTVAGVQIEYVME